MGLLIIAALWFFAFVGTPIVALNKNRNALGWFVLALLIGIFAFLLVALLPALPDMSAMDAERTNTKECPHCRSRIPWNASVCRYCARDVALSSSAIPAVPAVVASSQAAITGHADDCTCRSCAMCLALSGRYVDMTP